MSAAALSIALPYPPSLNRLWRHARGSGKPYLAPAYKAWRQAADAAFYMHRREWKPVAGHFKAVIVIDERLRRRDLDNVASKAVFDWLQRVELIENDKFCDKFEVSYGHAPEGVRISLYPVADARRAA